MTKTYFQDVGDFHAKFDLARYGERKVGLLDAEVFKFRLAFLQEELKEFADDHPLLSTYDVSRGLRNDEEKIAKAGDALVDLVYVALGTAHMMGLPFDEMWAEVHGKNMAKERASSADDPRSVRGSALDVVKPAGWTPPDHRPFIRRAIEAWRRQAEDRSELEGTSA